MDQSLIHKLHESPWQLVIATAGGGSLVISDLLTTSGASKTVLEAIAPYSAESLVHYLKHTPEQFCSAKTARQMAMAAFLRALELTTSETDHRKLAGVALTASLASDRPKQGDHRFHWAIQTQNTTICGTETLDKQSSRLEEERLAADCLLEEMFDAFGIGSFGRPARQKTTVSDDWVELFFGSKKTLPVRGDGAKPKSLFSGAYAPIHQGHFRMLEIVREKYATDVALEIAVQNVDKPPLDFIEIQNRLNLIPSEIPLWLSKLPTFEEKSVFFPKTQFVVGADTLKRVAEPKYYGNIERRDAAIRAIAQNGCSFLCFARRDGDMIESPETLEIPDSLRAITQSVPASFFCDDVSSTALRRNG